MSSDEIRKSFNSVFKERLTSPLYGSFILSWLVWNWKILYLTFFVSQDLIKPLTRVEYILQNYTNWYYLLLFPFISAILLVAVVPWLANKAYRISLFYEKERAEAKEKFDKNRRLTIEQSATIRNESLELQEKFQKQIDLKNTEITIAREQINKLTEDKNKLQNDLDIIDKDSKIIKILYARYGKNDTFIDVTEIVSNNVKSRNNFTVNNQELREDPLHGVPKELFIIYSKNKSIFTTLAKEHYQIDVTNDGLIVNETEISRKFYLPDVTEDREKNDYYQDH